ncbi:3-deoxy-D-manno-octulosonic acid transferase [Sedimentitalea todarodis]|uniref:3-deoxy-D-manno-octulosonic acid transferase n=1 Tax=Sedimentitalea todarodis TaxID=1631240 RepID=A0ABU3VD81_9RHOB|nr:glycosyltransferase N-terminal domain-containing protein [Sedimentitalea todarodis]MDU9004121.1 glycosyltransferase N-terminal domain-containing protein [Sedimentitalea todarodis]
MNRSLGLAAYRAFARRQPFNASAQQPPRPRGELIWAHATNEQRYSALCDLSLRLRIMRPDLHLLITIEHARFDPLPAPQNGCDHIVSLDSDHPGTAQGFLEHWQPDLCLWTGGHLMPNLIAAASEAKLPMILLDVGESDFPARRYNWLPDLTGASLACFDTILANTDTAAQMIRNVGVADAQIRVAARLRSCATPPLCSDDELAEVTNEISGRPVWLAAHVAEAEFDAVLDAHRAALRLLHRLLLVLVTHADADAEALKRGIVTRNMRSADWDTGDTIDDNTQIVLSRDADNLGLWYRLAPLTFMANSLTPGASGNSPLDAAALGSAVLYGSHVTGHMETYARLAAAGAARTVHDSESLGSAVVQLAAPDQAATMALSGWKVVTEGAHMTDELVDMILDQLDRGRANHAPT